MPDTPDEETLPVDCLIAKITDNLVAALSGQSVTIGDKSYTSVAEQQRSRYDSGGNGFYIEVCGPWPETLDETTMIKHVNLHYVVAAHVNDINDTAPEEPVTQQTRNLGADLAALIMADESRGGNALCTKIVGEPYYYFGGSVQNPEFIIRADVVVEAWLDAVDSFKIGA